MMEDLDVRRIVSLAAGAALLSTLVLAGAVAAQPPVGGCPPGDWELIEPKHQPQPADHNGDGHLCRKIFKDGSLLGIDNVFPGD